MNKILSFCIALSLLLSCSKTPEIFDWDGKWNFESYKCNNIQLLYKHFNIKKGGEIDLYMYPLVGADYLFINEGKAFALSGIDYRSGEFKIENDFIYINNQKAFEVIKGNPDELILKPLNLVFNQDEPLENDIVITYKKDNKYTTSELDYTDPKYNSWRNNQSEKETRQQIINRLTQQVEYSKIYFEKESNLHQQVNTIGVELPFKFYRNGVAVEKFHPSQKWLKYYLNFEDQEFAYQYLKHVFKESTYDEIKADDILTYNTIILSRMQEKLSQIKVLVPSEME